MKSPIVLRITLDLCPPSGTFVVVDHVEDFQERERIWCCLVLKLLPRIKVNSNQEHGDE